MQNLTVDDKVLNTLDPDQWYRGSLKLYGRGEFLRTFKGLKNDKRPGETIEYLSILLDACSESVKTDKTIGDLIKKKNLQFAQDIVNKATTRSGEAEIRLNEHRTEANQIKFDNSVLHIREAEELRDSIHPTDYYAKILTNESVEPIFGPIFNQILRGMKEMPEK